MPELSFPLRQRGAVVKILVRPADAEGPVAGPFSAYLDTGASHTMLDGSAIDRLGLEPMTEVTLNVLGRADASLHAVVAVEIAVVGGDGSPAPWVRLEALAGPVFATGGVAALGRDFLAQFAFVYDGPMGKGTLRW